MKTYLRIFISITLIVLFVISCNLFKNDEVKVHGCTDPEAYNYDIEADEDDGSCIYDCPKWSHFILITIDGGITWKKSCLFNNTGSQYPNEIFDISITDEQNIWVIADRPARIIHSADGGYNWEVQFQDESKTEFFDYIEMFDALKGVAMGEGKEGSTALILKTDDGGVNWNQVNITSPIAWYSGDLWRRIDFVNLNVGYFWWGQVGNMGLYKTTDGGITWIKTNFQPAGIGVMNVLKFYDENIGIVAEKSSEVISRTLDGGNTWESVNLPGPPGWGYDFEFSQTDPSKVWLLAGNSVYFSNDAGLTWTEQADLGILDTQDMVITDDEGWVLGKLIQYHSSDVIKGNWEEIILPVPDNIRFGYAIDGRSDKIVAIPGNVW